MSKGYLKLEAISKRVGRIRRIQGAKGSRSQVKCYRVIKIRHDNSIGKVERVLKAVIISLEKALDPLNPRILDSFVST
jgi:hypothetical protein